MREIRHGEVALRRLLRVGLSHHGCAESAGNGTGVTGT